MTYPQQTESISSQMRKKTRVLTLAIIIQHSFGTPYHGNQKKKRDCTTSVQVGVKNQHVGRSLIGNLGCLPKISLIKANAFCSLRCMVFIFSMSEAKGGW